VEDFKKIFQISWQIVKMARFEPISTHISPI
jgi:hypothetical protein